MKRFIGLLQEDLKSKLGMVVVIWYVLGMFCLLFSIKRTIPMGEVRSLYVGPGNTSFFVSAGIFGILMGAAAFHFLYSKLGRICILVCHLREYSCSRQDLSIISLFSQCRLLYAGCSSSAYR